MDGNSKTAKISRTVAAIPTALQRIDSACRTAGVSIAEATARWHFHHSQLTAGDGVIMGSVRMQPRTSPVWLSSCYLLYKRSQLRAMAVLSRWLAP